jgi:hypothetical protein
VDIFRDNPIYPLLSTYISTWTEPEALFEKKYNGLLYTTSNEYIWPKKFLIFMHGLKVPFWQFFRKADIALFNPCMKIKKIWGKMYSFEVINNSP